MQVGVNPLNPEVFFKELCKPLDDRFLLFRAVAGVASTLSLDHDITVSVHVVPLAQFRRYADFLPFYQNVLKEGIRYAS